MIVTRIFLIVLTFSCFPASRSAADDTARLSQRVESLIEAHEGDVAVSIRHLSSDFEFHHRADVPMPTASLIKFPVMIEAYRQADAGEIDLAKMITLKNTDKVPGSGILRTHFSDGTQLSLRDCIRLMMAWSDNTATNLVIEQLGIRATTETMERLGFPETKLHSKLYRRDSSVFPDRSEKYGIGSTTSREMIRLLELLDAGKLVSADASQEMLAHMLVSETDPRVTRYLPKNVRFAHKGGAISASRCDAGLLTTEAGTVAICVLTTNNKDRSWGDSNAAEILCGRIGEAVYKHFSPHGESGAPKSSLQIGDFGKQVESLQRTLNARLQPSPELSIDGDFGPATQAAVKQFQASRKLESTGIVDAAMLKALSPMLTSPIPVPSPDVVNKEMLPKSDAGDPHDPPVVSCDAWAMAHFETGELLWEMSASKQLPIASTTKIMTAYLVLKLAEPNPTVMDETITFSRRADQTRGSTAGILEGESLTVRELLYGLLLPSGNDASVALAEHFGPRLRQSDDDHKASSDPLDLFVAEMNRAAATLKMTRTSYRNPHGLDTPEHVSCAQDLIKLARAAYSLPLFPEYVSTRQRGCTVTGPGGYTRNVRWTNTNRLLKINGYGGIKTGTTSDAGACLVSTGERNGRKLIVVVLGSASSTGRYVDTRNLFRFAWRQLEEKSAEPSR